MEKLAFFSVLAVLLLPIALAETEIFSGKVITGTEKVIDGNTFKFTYDERSDKVFAQTPAGGLIIDNGACKPNSVFRVCINKANFSYKNITTYVYYYEIDATIYKLTGSLSTTSKATLDTLLQGEPSQLTITVTNPTDFEITNIALNYDIRDFTVNEVKGCALDGTKISWQGSLKSKYDKACIAAIIAQKEGTFNLNGNLSYFNGFETEKKPTDTLTIKVLPKQLKASFSFDRNAEVNQPFYFNVSLQNIHDAEKIEESVTVELPSNMKLLKEVPFTKEFNILKRSLILEPKSSFNYSLRLQASSWGNNPIRQKFDYTIKDIRDIIENDTLINVIDPKPIINFSAEYAELIPGQKFAVLATLKNPSKLYRLKSIRAKLDSPSGNAEESLDKLEPDASYILISSLLKLPEQFAGDTAWINLGIEYDFDGETKFVNQSLEIKVKQANITSALASKNITRENTTQAARAEPKPENKTIVIAAEKPKPNLFSIFHILNRWVLIFIAVAFAAFLIIFFAINRMQKRGKTELKLGEKEIQQVEQLHVSIGQPAQEKPEQAPQQEITKRISVKKQKKKKSV